MKYLGFACLAVGLLALIVTPNAARASFPNAVRVAVTRIEWEPDARAPRAVRLYGPIALWSKQAMCTSGGAPRGGHPPATCGRYLYYRCPAGKESVCLMEWTDVERARATSMHATFGLPDVLPRMRPLDETPAAPDEWTFNVGVMVGEPLFCTRPQDWICPGESWDAGSADGPAPARVGDAAGAATATPANPASMPPPEKKSGCSYGANARTNQAPPLCLLVAAAILGRRFRRRL